MPSIALHTVLTPGHESEYDRIHAVVPEDVATALRENGVHDWRIWRDGRDVFHLVEVDDYHAMRNALRDDPRNVAWQERVGPLFDRADNYDSADDGLGFLWSLAEQLRATGDRREES